ALEPAEEVATRVAREQHKHARLAPVQGEPLPDPLPQGVRLVRQSTIGRAAQNGKRRVEAVVEYCDRGLIRIEQCEVLLCGVRMDASRELGQILPAVDD